MNHSNKSKNQEGELNLDLSEKLNQNKDQDIKKKNFKENESTSDTSEKSNFKEHIKDETLVHDLKVKSNKSVQTLHQFSPNHFIAVPSKTVLTADNTLTTETTTLPATSNSFPIVSTETLQTNEVPVQEMKMEKENIEKSETLPESEFIERNTKKTKKGGKRRRKKPRIIHPYCCEFCGKDVIEIRRRKY